MVERLRSLGLPGVTARTFHAHALSQLRHFWPSRHDGAPLPAAARLQDPDPRPARAPAARPLPVHAGEGPRRRDRVGEGAPDRPARRTSARPRACAGPRAADPGRPVRPRLRRLRAGQGRARAGSTSTTSSSRRSACSRTTPRPPTTVRARKRWFSVDEYQDTSPLQQRLLELWLGDRTDLCVVGDVDQTIYTFTGATSDYLTTFAERHPGARILDLTRNYRSTPQVLELANRLIAAEGRSKRLDREPRRTGPSRRSRSYADRRGRVGRDGRARSAALHPRRHRARRDRDARPDERPDRADRGGADPGRHRVPGARRSASTTGPRSRRAIASMRRPGPRRDRARAASTRSGARLGRRGGLRGGRRAASDGREARERAVVARDAARDRRRRSSAPTPTADVASVLAELRPARRPRARRTPATASTS